MTVQNVNNSAQRDGGSVGDARSIVPAGKAGAVDFSRIMHARAGELKFSAHAQTRLKSRNIQMTGEMMSRLAGAVSSAQRKGSQDTLVLLADLAFIVNVPNKTVVTAMEGKNIKDNVFTNIDSTVIAD